MAPRTFRVIAAAATCLGCGAAAYADALQDLNSCRRHQADSIAACDRVIEACKDFNKLGTFKAAACPLYVHTNQPDAFISIALAGTYVDRAIAYSSRQDLDSALADYESALAWSSPYSGQAYLGRGQILLVKGRYELVVANATAAIGMPLNEPAMVASFHGQRASAYLQLDRFDLCRADLDRAIALKPRPDLYLLRANLSTFEGKFDQAHADVAVVLQQQPSASSALITRGFIYRQQKRWEAALTDLNKAIDLQPPALPAVLERARVYADMGELDRALEDLDKVLAGPWKTSAAYLERGLARLAKGTRDGAKSDFAAVLTFPPLRSARGNTHVVAKAALAKM